MPEDVSPSVPSAERVELSRAETEDYDEEEFDADEPGEYDEEDAFDDDDDDGDDDEEDADEREDADEQADAGEGTDADEEVDADDGPGADAPASVNDAYIASEDPFPQRPPGEGIDADDDADADDGPAVVAPAPGTGAYRASEDLTPQRPSSDANVSEDDEEQEIPAASPLISQQRPDEEAALAPASEQSLAEEDKGASSPAAALRVGDGASASDYKDDGGDDALDIALSGINFTEGTLALKQAISLFTLGDYAGAEDKAIGFIEDAPRVFPEDGIGAAGDVDDWKRALDGLSAAHVKASSTDGAETLNLQMMAWREASELFRAGTFGPGGMLFSKSSEYKTVEDATWFLSGVRPDDGHSVQEAVALLAMGEQIAAKTAVAVWTLALRPKHRPRITECGGLELMVKAVSLHADNPELQAAGCGTLRMLCQGHRLAEHNRQALVGRLGGVEAVTAAMRRHQADPEIQREACGALRAASAGYPVGARRVVECDGVLLCLEALASCPGDQAVGDAACSALACICGGGSGTASASTMDGTTDAATVLPAQLLAGAQPTAVVPAQAGPGLGPGPAGGVVEPPADTSLDEAMWQVKLREKRDEGLRFCTDLLDERLVEGDMASLQAIMWAIMIFLDDPAVRQRYVGLVKPVVECMNMFTGHIRVQVPACGILWRLTVGHPAREDAVAQAQLGRNSGIVAICQAMRDLPKKGELQRIAISAIRNLCFGNDASKTFVVRANGVPAIIAAMRTFARDGLIQEQALGALTSICDTVGRASICARLGGVDAIIQALRRHASSGHMAELGCILLCMFCDDPQLRSMILRSGALAVAKDLSRTGNPEARQWGLELLRDLSDAHAP